MRVILCENYEEMSEKAANLVASQITLKPDCVLGLATGSTPICLYQQLIKRYQDGTVDFSQVTTFNLDEYYPIRKDNPQSYAYFMRKNLFDHINIPPENTHIPNGETDDPYEECASYESAIARFGGIDLQILGIGQNGHIGFNEPDHCLNSYTHLTELTESTLQANARFFDETEQMPTKALTMGITTILKAKKIVLLANGASKNRVVSALLNEEINTSIPATMLKTHPDVVLICDRDAFECVKLGVSLGKNHLHFAVSDGKNILHTSCVDAPKTQEALIETVGTTCRDLRKQFHVKAVGIGTPGTIRNGLVSAVHLPFSDTPLTSLLKKYVDIPIVLENKAGCGALGEIAFGAAKGCENVLFITLGTGIGGGIVVGGQLCRGKKPAGEIGHMIVQIGGKPCRCGQYGCWEQYASETALFDLADHAAKDAPESVLGKVCASGVTLAAIRQALDENCPVAQSVYDQYLSYLAAGITSLANIFGPDMVLLAGNIPQTFSDLQDRLQPLVPADLSLAVSALQSDASALGATLL